LHAVGNTGGSGGSGSGSGGGGVVVGSHISGNSCSDHNSNLSSSSPPPLSRPPSSAAAMNATYHMQLAHSTSIAGASEPNMPPAFPFHLTAALQSGRSCRPLPYGPLRLTVS
jgi:hypothetical protein